MSARVPADTPARSGYQAEHINYIGLRATPDRQLVRKIVAEDYTFITNDRSDFIALYRTLPLHAGLIILKPNVSPAQQRRLLRAALRVLGGDLINSLLAVEFEGDEVRYERYFWPAPLT